jgi:antitoxin ParD1/3/4
VKRADAKDVVDAPVGSRGSRARCESLWQLIRKDQDRLQLREMLHQSGRSKPAPPASAAYFAALRERVTPRT